MRPSSHFSPRPPGPPLVDTLVVGRKTYETALGFDSWPYAGKQCVVMTSTKPTPRHSETFHDGEPGALVDRLSESGVKRIYVDGGAVMTGRARLAEVS